MSDNPHDPANRLLSVRARATPEEKLRDAVLKVARKRSRGAVFSYRDLCVWLSLPRTQENRRRLSECCEWLTKAQGNKTVPSLVRDRSGQTVPSYRLMTESEAKAYEAELRRHGLGGFPKRLPPLTNADYDWI